MRNYDKEIQTVYEIIKIAENKYAINELIEYFKKDPLFKDEIEIRRKCNNNEYLMRLESETKFTDEAFTTLNILRSIKRNVNRFVFDLDWNTFKEHRGIISKYNRLYEIKKRHIERDYTIEGNGFRNRHIRQLKVYPDKMYISRREKEIYQFPCKPILFIKSDELLNHLEGGMKTEMNKVLNFHPEKITAYNYIFFVIMEQNNKLTYHFGELNIRRKKDKVVVQGYNSKIAIEYGMPIHWTEEYEYDTKIKEIILDKVLSKN